MRHVSLTRAKLWGGLLEGCRKGDPEVRRVGEITLEEFEREVKAFLDANAEPRVGKQGFRWGEGSDDVAIFEERDPEEELRLLEEAKAWRRKRWEAGLGWISGPPEYGGRGLSAAHERLYQSLESKYRVPDQSFFGIGLGMVAPTILAHGTEEVKRRYLPGLYSGEIVGCQLFSEPGAGSDLASLQTRAERDGDTWVVTGQKVWTSGAHYSDIGEIVCRTDLDQPKHRGITAFVVDMHAPGVEVRPLRQMTGGAAFNEVFFDEVRIPDSHRLGEVNGGWAVAITTLMNERAAIGAGAGGGFGLANLERLRAMVRHFGVADDPVIRQRLADVYIGWQVAKLTNQRALDKLRAGQAPGPELSTAKLSLTRNLQRTAEFVAQVLGPRITADTGEWGTFAWAKFLCGVPGMRIAGGTDEILRNIIGERVLGLPKDPAIDTTSPFKELKVGTQR
ncbi:MAG: acyl-CoA dehydrogenase [Acidimicrobiales bacterium]|nr:MAG: acyl-CoA dehydrogenase [Acidimicrobiales bacterium]